MYWARAKVLDEASWGQEQTRSLQSDETGSESWSIYKLCDLDLVTTPS